MLEITQVFKSFGGLSVLMGVSLECERGEAVCLVGANATGKTTLLTIAAGLQKPDAGEMCADGSLGFVAQETALLADLSVRDNLRLWYAAASRGKPFEIDSVEYALGLLPHANKRVARLSGGMKKRAAIACALVGKPAYLLLDEPFTALDLPSRTDICALFNQLKTQGAGLLFSSHDPAAITAVADRLVVLSAGEVRDSITLVADEPQRLKQIMSALSEL